MTKVLREPEIENSLVNVTQSHTLRNLSIINYMDSKRLRPKDKRKGPNLSQVGNKEIYEKNREKEKKEKE